MSCYVVWTIPIAPSNIPHLTILTRSLWFHFQMIFSSHLTSYFDFFFKKGMKVWSVRPGVTAFWSKLEPAVLSVVVRSIFSVADWILLLLLLSFSCVSYINIFGSLLLSALSAGYSMVSSVKKHGPAGWFCQLFEFLNCMFLKLCPHRADGADKALLNVSTFILHNSFNSEFIKG